MKAKIKEIWNFGPMRHTKFGIGIWLSAMQWRPLSHRASVVRVLHPICSMHFGKYRVAQKCKFIIKVKSRWDIIYCHQIWRDYYPFPVAPTFIATRIEPLLFLGNLIWAFLKPYFNIFQLASSTLNSAVLFNLQECLKFFFDSINLFTSLRISPKLYIPSTLNIDLIRWL